MDGTVEHPIQELKGVGRGHPLVSACHRVGASMLFPNVQLYVYCQVRILLLHLIRFLLLLSAPTLPSPPTVPQPLPFLLLLHVFLLFLLFFSSSSFSSSTSPSLPFHLPFLLHALPFRESVQIDKAFTTRNSLVEHQTYMLMSRDTGVHTRSSPQQTRRGGQS